MKQIKANAGREYGHCPGRNYLDVELKASRGSATLTITWGSAQGRGCDEEHGRAEYTRRGPDTLSAVERVRDAALAEEKDEETRRYIETASSRALTPKRAA